MPNTLDFGVTGQASTLADVLPYGVLQAAAGLRHWVAENAKTARAFLKRVEQEDYYDRGTNFTPFSLQA